MTGRGATSITSRWVRTASTRCSPCAQAQGVTSRRRRCRTSYAAASGGTGHATAARRGTLEAGVGSTGGRSYGGRACAGYSGGTSSGAVRYSRLTKHSGIRCGRTNRRTSSYYASRRRRRSTLTQWYWWRRGGARRHASTHSCSTRHRSSSRGHPSSRFYMPRGRSFRARCRCATTTGGLSTRPSAARSGSSGSLRFQKTWSSADVAAGLFTRQLHRKNARNSLRSSNIRTLCFRARHAGPRNWHGLDPNRSGLSSKLSHQNGDGLPGYYRCLRGPSYESRWSRSRHTDGIANEFKTRKLYGR